MLFGACAVALRLATCHSITSELCTKEVVWRDLLLSCASYALRNSWHCATAGWCAILQCCKLTASRLPIYLCNANERAAWLHVGQVVQGKGSNIVATSQPQPMEQLPTPPAAPDAACWTKARLVAAAKASLTSLVPRNAVVDARAALANAHAHAPI